VGGGEGLSRRLHRRRCHPGHRKDRGVLAAADVFTHSTTFWVMESIRLDLGFASYVQP